MKNESPFAIFSAFFAVDGIKIGDGRPSLAFPVPMSSHDPAGQDPVIALAYGREALDQLSRPDVIATPFQRATWLARWHESRDGQGDLVLATLAYPAGQIMLPLAMRRAGPIRLADIAGEKHASLHAPVLAGILPSSFVLEPALKHLGERLAIDAFTFADQPVTIDGVPNPLLAGAGQPSPSSAWQLSLSADGEALMGRLLDRDDRKKIRQKIRKLGDLGGPVVGRFAAGEEMPALLGHFHRWKATRFGARGIDNPFEQAEARAFLAAGLAGPDAPMALFVLESGSTPVALMIGARSPSRFSGMANAHDPDPALARVSPGDVLLAHLVPALQGEGLRYFDLGVGEARYKARWCPEELRLHDRAFAITGIGKIAARSWLLARSLKRQIKRNPGAMAMLDRLRRLGAR